MYLLDIHVLEKCYLAIDTLAETDISDPDSNSNVAWNYKSRLETYQIQMK